VECVFWWLVDGIFGLGILELRPRDSWMDRGGRLWAETGSAVECQRVGRVMGSNRCLRVVGYMETVCWCGWRRRRKCRCGGRIPEQNDCWRRQNCWNELRRLVSTTDHPPVLSESRL
jgi:hypothetical protein